MGAKMKPAEGAMTLAEMKEFAGFVSSTQRYIRRSLDVGLDRDDRAGARRQQRARQPAGAGAVIRQGYGAVRTAAYKLAALRGRA